MLRKKYNISHGDFSIKFASYIINTFYEDTNNEYILKLINQHNEDIIKKIYKPNKKTILHDYIEVLIILNYNYLLDKYFYLEVIYDMIELMEYFNIDYSDIDNFEFINLSEEEISKKYEEKVLINLAEKLYERFNSKLLFALTDDVFTILYSNKNFLYNFNNMITEIIKTYKLSEYTTFMKKDGVLNRATIPEWLKRGLYHRDKGICQICSCDVSQHLNLYNKINIDHIIPLELGGCNDPINFQLTCEHCNKSKGAKETNFNNFANPYWEQEGL